MKQFTANQTLMTAEERHRSLSEEVRVLERRAYLTPDEQRHMTELKKQKLLAKDELFSLRR